MTQPLPPSDKHEDRDEASGLNWARIAGISFVIAVHAAALLLLLAPVTPAMARPLKSSHIVGASAMKL